MTLHQESSGIVLASREKWKGNEEQKEQKPAFGCANGACALQLQGKRASWPRWAVPPRAQGCGRDLQASAALWKPLGGAQGGGVLFCRMQGNGREVYCLCFLHPGLGSESLALTSVSGFLCSVVWKGSARVSVFRRWSPGSRKLGNPGIARFGKH